MVLVDTNALVVIVLGMMDPSIINTHKTTSIYEIEDYETIMSLIDYDLNKILVLPSTLTELDNLLNSFNGRYRELYNLTFRKILTETTEKTLSSRTVENSFYLPLLGLTDSLILHLAPEFDALITSDSLLSDYANSLGINVFDMVKARNERLG
ncbi:hypothetical protein [Pedobacter sp. GR22-6]|uniref:hypothetical protein n=1 Tax=Pedobacter sp. GR22-6 TaxID=3127957 RepID=UPI00307F472E